MNLGAFGEGIVTIIGMFVALAVVATLVSRNAQTSGVIQAGAGGVAEDIGAAVSPVTGQNITPTFPSQSMNYGT